MSELTSKPGENSYFLDHDCKHQYRIKIYCIATKSAEPGMLSHTTMVIPKCRLNEWIRYVKGLCFALLIIEDSEVRKTTYVQDVQKHWKDIRLLRGHSLHSDVWVLISNSLIPTITGNSKKRTMGILSVWRKDKGSSISDSSGAIFKNSN